MRSSGVARRQAPLRVIENRLRRRSVASRSAPSPRFVAVSGVPKKVTGDFYGGNCRRVYACARVCVKQRQADESGETVAMVHRSSLWHTQSQEKNCEQRIQSIVSSIDVS